MSTPRTLTPDRGLTAWACSLCGRAVPVACGHAHDLAHPLTGQVDAEGNQVGDIAAVLCDRCRPFALELNLARTLEVFAVGLRRRLSAAEAFLAASAEVDR